MKTKRIVIIGAGAHARYQHYPALHSIPEIELCAACDLIQPKLEEVRRLYDIPAGYGDYREMIAKESPDGVVVVLRPMEMVDVALGCLDLGANLMIEKPPGCNSQEAQRILDRAQARGCKVMVSLNRRFMPMVRRLKDMARERKLVHRSATYNKSGFFKNQWTWPCSLPVCDSIHLIDLLRFVGGEVAEVYAASAKRDAEFTNSHSAAIVYESGAMATVNTHHCVGARVQHFEIHAESMSAYMDVGDTQKPSCELWLDGKRAELSFEGEPCPEKVGPDSFHETRHFARFAVGEEEGEATLADAIKSVRLAEAIVGGYRGEMRRFA